MTADVDVLVPVRNAGRYLQRAVDSILAQEGVRVRMLIVDDGSTDAAVERLPRDPRIVVIDGPARGIPHALNAALAEARAPYVARQDADDESLPGRLRAEVDYLDAHPGIGLVATGFDVLVGERVVSTTRTLPAGMLDKNPICAGSTVVRADVVDRVGGYRPAFAFSSDYDMWLRCLGVTGVAILPMIGYRYRLTAHMSTVRHASRQAAYAELARTSARARLAGRPDPVEQVDTLCGDPAADIEVSAWWAREFAALGSRRDATACLRRLPARRAARMLPLLLRKQTAQVAWP